MIFLLFLKSYWIISLNGTATFCTNRFTTKQNNIRQTFGCILFGLLTRVTRSSASVRRRSAAVLSARSWARSNSWDVVNVDRPNVVCFCLCQVFKENFYLIKLIKTPWCAYLDKNKTNFMSKKNEKIKWGKKTIYCQNKVKPKNHLWTFKLMA